MIGVEGMMAKDRETLVAVVIGVIQAFVTAGVGYLLQGKLVIFLLIVLVVNVVAFVLVWKFFKRKLKERDAILQLYKNVGIDGCTEELKGTRFEPRQCMRDVNRYLDFMGVGGNKWVDQDDKLELFENMLKKVQAANGKVRFLLINPNCKSYSELKKLRNNKVPSKSYKIFRELVEKYECLEVHLYNDLPSFRLQFVNQEYVAVSRYYIEHELHSKKDFGWKIPHIIVRAEKIINIQTGETEYSATLYKSFETLYQFIWEHSQDIKQKIKLH